MPHKSTARTSSSSTGSSPASPGTSSPFVQDVEMLRRRARENMECGAITQSYGADRQVVIDVLNAALATEIVCVLRYKRHYFMAQGIASESVKAEFLEHANEEQQHADKLCERIVQLGGEPDLNPEHLAERSHSQYVEGKDLVDMIREDLVAERIAIDSYREIVQWLADRDPTSRRVMEEILANEEEHAEDLGSMLQGMGTSGIGGNGSAARQ
ncbi:MAG: bacterioferritin [Burkholderiaceae bacterium]|nr:bacterioferritin [Burkholderiaceae bacterium]